MIYDAIVIGSGPAGSTTAKILASKGLSVLILEAQKLPRYKSCSGCLIKRSIDLVHEYFGKSVPESTMCTPFENKGMIFFDDKGKKYDFPQPGLNVWRSEFDFWLTEQAVESGAKLRDESRVISIEQNSDFVTVKTAGKNPVAENSRYVIDCEGAIGVVKKSILETKPSFITTYQSFNEGTINLDLHYFYAYLQPEFSEYDAWFNVKDDMLVLGVSAKEHSKIPEYYKQFINYMKEKHGLVINNQQKEEKWLLPHITPDFNIDYARNRVFFAGEAAGFLNPMGEGISCGMESGFYLATSIAEHFENPKKVEESYKELVNPVLKRMIRQWKFVGSIADTFSEMK